MRATVGNLLFRTAAHAFLHPVLGRNGPVVDTTTIRVTDGISRPALDTRR
jgi:hypothetical protein